MKIICTICSKKKNTQTGFLPAKDRYLGDHINTASNISQKQKCEFFILSGKYGLIHAQEPIPYYDYLLTDDAADKLTEKVGAQIKENNITEIIFYTENNPNWKPYEKVITSASEKLQVSLRVQNLPT
ncbi:MAG: DUF6884 domain-containing protein [Patescibacteria group bacterium UBA2103]